MPSFPTNTFVGQTIGFSELEGSPSRAHSNGVSVITIQGMTAWTDAPNFVVFIMPVGSNYGGQIGTSWNVDPKFRVFDYAVEGFGGISGVDAYGANQYPLAKWTIKLHVPVGQLPDFSQPYNQDPVALLQHEWKPGGQFLTLNNRQQRWLTDNKYPSVRVPGAIFIPTIEHSITWPKLLNPPFAAIRAAMNTINSAPFQLATGTIATGQGMFIGAEVKSEILSDSSLGRTLTYHITERPLYVNVPGTGNVALDWNKFLRDDNQPGYQKTGWDDLIQNPGGVGTIKNFPSYNFSNLFPNTF
jgi:hypothetical protein